MSGKENDLLEDDEGLSETGEGDAPSDEADGVAKEVEGLSDGNTGFFRSLGGMMMGLFDASVEEVGPWNRGVLRVEATEFERRGCLDDVPDCTESFLADNGGEQVCAARGDAVGVDDSLVKVEPGPLWKLEEGCLFGNKAD